MNARTGSKWRSARVRDAVVFLHRWVGLVMALFLIIEGLSGSLLAFRWDLARWLDPRQVAHAPYPGAPQLDLATLIERAEALGLHAKLRWALLVRDDEVLFEMVPRIDPATKKPYVPEFEYIAMDPWTGRDLVRYETASPKLLGAQVMPFVYSLHKRLALDETGEWVLAIVALAWLVDCFVGVYLTLPAGAKALWRRWKPAWLIRFRSGAYRLNFDLHRAGSLWLWLVLLVFAVSSVELVDLTGFYNWTAERLFGPGPSPVVFPPETGAAISDWHGAQEAGERIAEGLTAERGIHKGRATLLNGPEDDYPAYQYRVETPRGFPRDQELWFEIDARTGKLLVAHDVNSGNRYEIVSNWLVSLHMIASPVDYLPYRLFVCLFGVALAVISGTGVYIWWKKRRARKIGSQKRSTNDRRLAVRLEGAPT
jgi:uncharacterized iron-regulated membrane protein